MKWSTLVDRAILPFGSDMIHKKKAKKYLVEAERDFAMYTKCYERERVIYAESGVVKNELPEDFIELKWNVEYDGLVLDQFNNQYPRRNASNTLLRGKPSHYFLENNKLALYPEPQADGKVHFRYSAIPHNIEESTTAYKKMGYNTLTSGMFIAGTQIKGKTSNATATVEFDDSDEDTGTLVLSSVTGTFQANEDIYTNDTKVGMWTTTLGSFDSLFSSWDAYGLGGRAKVVGVAYDFTDAGEQPIIDSIYHDYLVDFAKSMMAEDIGDQQRATLFLNRYYANREKCRESNVGKGASNMSMTVTDLSGGSIY
tara:strand:- start:6268 stop:7203 length:936 start_codon:yes stop_codon:yes gene_type:complete